MVGMLRALGFDLVVEVAFGADLVARRVLGAACCRCNGNRYISTTCPAIVSYVERYYPGPGRLAGADRLADDRHGPGPAATSTATDLKVVFIGPCIAKKVEARGRVRGRRDRRRAHVSRAAADVRRRRASIRHGVEPSDFDPPHGGAGGLFPISRGMLQAADLREDLLTGEIVATQGRSHVLEAIKEFADGDLGAKLLEVLCCEGCIMGAGHDQRPAAVQSPPAGAAPTSTERMKTCDHERMAARHGGDVAIWTWAAPSRPTTSGSPRRPAASSTRSCTAWASVRPPTN